MATGLCILNADGTVQLDSESEVTIANASFSPVRKYIKNTAYVYDFFNNYSPNIYNDSRGQTNGGTPSGAISSMSAYYFDKPSIDGFILMSAADGANFNMWNGGSYNNTSVVDRLWFSANSLNVYYKHIIPHTNPSKGYFDVYNSAGKLMWSVASMFKSVRLVTTIKVPSVAAVQSINLASYRPSGIAGRFYVYCPYGYFYTSTGNYGGAGVASTDYIATYFRFSNSGNTLSYWMQRGTGWRDDSPGAEHEFEGYRSSFYTPSASYPCYLQIFFVPD